MEPSSPTLSILFPAHNEELRLPDALKQADEFICRQPFACELIIIENASVDRTFEIAKSFARDHSYVTVAHEELPGKGRAVQKGMFLARGAYRFICDVDLSMPITEITRFLPPQRSDYEIAIGSREAPGAHRYDEPPYRHTVGRVFNTLVRLLIVPELNDTQCGFKCFTAKAAEELFPLMTIYGWTFDVEILAIARQKHFRIVEVSIPWYYRGNSKIHVMRDSVNMALDLLRIRRNLRRRIYSH